MANALFHPEAAEEYREASDRYRAVSARTIARFEAEVERVLDLAETFPEMYPLYDDDHRFAVLRRFPYCVIYQVRSGQIYVVALAHTSRPPGYWQGRA